MSIFLKMNCWQVGGLSLTGKAQEWWTRRKTRITRKPDEQARLQVLHQLHLVSWAAEFRLFS